MYLQLVTSYTSQRILPWELFRTRRNVTFFPKPEKESNEAWADTPRERGKASLHPLSLSYMAKEAALPERAG
jgi:hypothetical protein